MKCQYVTVLGNCSSTPTHYILFPTGQKKTYCVYHYLSYVMDKASNVKASGEIPQRLRNLE